MDITKFTEQATKESHCGLIIVVERDGDEVIDKIAFGGCLGCLATAISEKMRRDDNFEILITCAIQLYANQVNMRCEGGI